jgi:SLT domain-containing protein
MDGAVTIKVDLEQKNVKSDAKVISEILDDMGKDAGATLDEAMKKNLAKMSDEVKKKLEGAKGDFQKTQKIINDELKKPFEMKTDLKGDDVVKEKAHGLRRLLGSLPKVSKMTLSATDKASAAIKGVGRAASVTHKSMSGLKSVIAGTLIAGAITSGARIIISSLHEAADAGAEYNKTQQVMGATWNTLTDSAAKGGKMVKSINDMSTAFGQSTDLVNELDQQFYHVFDNQPRTEKLTKAVLTLGDTLGMSGEDLNRLGLNFTHMLGSSLLQLGDFNMITDQLPMFGEKLLEYERKVQKNSHLTMAQLRKEMSAGKISAQDAEAVMEQLGDKYSKASENMMATIPGMERIVSSRMPALIGAFEKPFMKAQSGLFSGLSKWVSATHTEKLFTGMGDAASKGMTTIINAFGKVFGAKGVTKTADNALEGITKGITRFSNFIADHAGDIVKFFNAVKDKGATAFEFFGNVLKITSSLLTPIMKMIASDPKDFAALATGIYVVVKAFKAMQVITALLGITMDATPIGWIITAVGLLAIGAAELIIHWKSVKKFFSGLWPWMKSAAHSAGNAIVKGWNATTSQFTSRSSWLNKHTHGAFSTMFKGMKTVAKDGYAVLKDQQQTWNDIFHGRWSKVGKDVQKTARDYWKAIKSYFHAGYSVLNDLTGGRLEAMRKTISRWGSRTISWFKSLPHKWADGIRSGYSGMVNAAEHMANGLISGIAKGINGVGSGVNWILGKFHVSDKFRVPTFHPHYYAAGGRALGPSIVGERGKHELIKHADGHIEMSPARATLYNFRQPVDILGGDKTEQLMGGAPKYGIGTWLGEAADFVKGGFSAIASGGEAFWNAVTHPKQLVMTAIDKFTDMGKVAGLPLSVAEGGVKTVASGAVDYVKKMFTTVNPGGSGAERWRPFVIRALGMNGLSTSTAMVDKVLRQIGSESGGNPTAVQHGYTDVNTISGDLAKGLMQTISATFNAYKFPGFGNIFNGFDNILAALNYAKHRYGKNLSALGNGHGYANGTNNSAGGDVTVGEIEPEVITTADGQTHIVSRPTRFSNFPSGSKVIPMSKIRKLGDGTTARTASFLNSLSSPSVNVPLTSQMPTTDGVRAQNSKIEVNIAPQVVQVVADGKVIAQTVVKWQKKDQRIKNLAKGVTIA